MQQLSFIEAVATPKIVNVASVPQRSPFRYPGGKTWLVPQVRDWLRSLPKRPTLFIEPFGGGGIISLTVACEQLADRVLMVELDAGVAAVWKTIVEGDAAWLGEEIVRFTLTPETFRERLARPADTTAELAFQTILKNRVNRGGILAPGAGVSKVGENGKGILSRWYPQTLRRRILDIAMVRDRITFIEGDGLAVLRQHRERADTVTFIDPPYTAGGKRAGSRLYNHTELDHGELFAITASFSGDFLMTYDDAAELHQLAAHHRFQTRTIAMKNTHHAKMNELLIGRRLDWLA